MLLDGSYYELQVVSPFMEWDLEEVHEDSKMLSDENPFLRPIKWTMVRIRGRIVLSDKIFKREKLPFLFL